MSEAQFIKRRSKSTPDLYRQLRREGVDSIQRLSGEQWTDFNAHDPGVTILEQLCYSLTDIAYRSGFKVEDLLTRAEEGGIDYQASALYMPEQILSCRATTVEDYRKLILDQIPELDDVWVVPCPRSSRVSVAGLYQILLQPSINVQELNRQALVQQVRDIFVAYRNLGEDLLGIEVVKAVSCTLYADIEMASLISPANLLASIYTAIYRLVSDGVEVLGYDALASQKLSLDEIFDGPFTKHGRLEKEQFKQPGDKVVHVADCFNLLSSLEGVESINQLYFEIDGKPEYDTLQPEKYNQALALQLPSSLDDIKVRLSEKGRPVLINWSEFQARMDDQQNHSRNFRKTIQDLSHLYQLPIAHHYPVDEYTSIADQFPDEYGVNHFGVPKDYPVERKAQALQLKSYLMLFEQLLANSLASLSHLPLLYSLDKDCCSYSFQVIDDEMVTDASRIYPANPESMLEGLRDRYDPRWERKGRVLDYLLSLYGESLNQKQVTGIDLYCGAHNLNKQLVKNKIEYLKNVVEINRDRTAGLDYCKPSLYHSNQTGFVFKVSHLLGFAHHQMRSLTLPLISQGYHILSDDENSEEVKKLADKVAVHYQHYLSQSQGTYKIDHRILDEIELLSERWIAETMMKEGVNLSNYKLVGLSTSNSMKLIFRSYREKKRRWSLASYSSAKQATRAVHALQRFIAHLNQQCEGLHMVDHMLLRPRSERAMVVDDPFYSFRVSLLLPRWTARCSDEGFQIQAERTISEQCPAHIYPTVHWLSFSEMCQFEIYYKAWLDKLADNAVDSAVLDDTSRELVIFLKGLERSHEG